MNAPTRPVERPHAPPGGFWRRRLGRFHVTGVFWFRFHAWAVRVMPRWFLFGVTIPFFHMFFLVTLVRIRRAVASNLAVVLGPVGWFGRLERARRTFWNFAVSATERYLPLERRVDTRCQYEGIDHWTAALGTGDGFVMVTAHVGSWETGALFPTTNQPRDVHLVREEELDPRAQEFIEEVLARQEAQRFHTHFARDDPRLGFELLRALREGAVVALQGDRPRAGGRSAEVPFFGRTTAYPVGPAALARAAGVPILPVFVLRNGYLQSRVCFRPLIEVADGGPEELEAATARIAAEVEWAIRQEPHQWFCFRELWPATSSRS